MQKKKEKKSWTALFRLFQLDGRQYAAVCVAAAAAVLSLCGRFMEALLRACWTTFSRNKTDGGKGEGVQEKTERRSKTEGDREKFYGVCTGDRLTDLIVFITSQFPDPRSQAAALEVN